ncbi:MAG: hypothetical protein AAFR11_15605 [Pseudomonadota bacterium]
MTSFCNMLAGLAKRHDCAVILLAHPSIEGMKSKRGDSGSTAWSNSVRHRLYFYRPEVDEGQDEDFDARELSTKKTNIGKLGFAMQLRWLDGAFIVDERAAAAATDAEIEDAIVAGLNALLEKGTPNNASRNQSNYAPKELVRTVKECGAFGEKRIAAIFERMRKAGRLKAEDRPTKIGPRKFIIPCEPERLKL